MKKTLFSLFALITVLAMVLSACGTTATTAPVVQPTTAPVKPTEVPTTAPVEPTAAPTTPPATSGKVIIRWFVGLGTGTDPGQGDKQLAVVNDFNASQDKITLILEVVPYNSARDVLSTEIAAGQGPDIIGPVGWSGGNAFYGQWLDISPYITKSGYDTSVFNPALVKFYQTEEGQIGLPFAVYPAMVFYQKKMFDEAGLAYPPAKYGEKYKMPDGSEVEWNYDTLTAIAKLLTVDVNGKNSTEDGFDATQVAQYGYQPQYQHPNHEATFWEASKIYEGDPGAYKAVIPDTWKAAWTWWFDGIWGKQPFIPSSTWYGVPENGGGNPFNGGKVAMVITHMWYTCCVDTAGQNWDLAALPSYNGTVHGRVDADTFRIWKGTKHPDEAVTVMTYLVGPGVQKLIIGTADVTPAYGAMPALTSEIDKFFEAKKAQFPWVTNWDVVKAGLDYPDTPSGEGYMPNFNEAWDRINTFGNLIQTDGTIDINATIQTLQDDLTVIFNKK